MASSWGQSWGNSWGNSWGIVITVPDGVGFDVLIPFEFDANATSNIDTSPKGRLSGFGDTGIGIMSKIDDQQN